MAVEILTYRPDHFESVASLWQETFPDDPEWNAPQVAIPAKSAIQPDLFLVAVESGCVLGSTMAGYDGHRGWLYAAAVLNEHRDAESEVLLFVRQKPAFGRLAA